MSAIRRRSWAVGCIRFGLHLLPRALRHLLIRGCWLCRRSRPCDCGRSGSGLCQRLGQAVSELLGCRRGCGSQIRVGTRWGPISRTASSAGYSVTAAAKVQRVVWAMGDGTTVTCTERGTPYADSLARDQARIAATSTRGRAPTRCGRPPTGWCPGPGSGRAARFRWISHARL